MLGLGTVTTPANSGFHRSQNEVGGVLTATMYGTDVTSALVQNLTIVLTPSMVNGAISWTCSGTLKTTSPQYIAKNC